MKTKNLQEGFIRIDALSVERLKDASVLVIGDVMLDRYLMGDTDRVSPEAPVPVVAVRTEKKLLGGAGNVARNAAALGAKVTLIGNVGQDSRGGCVHRLLESEKIISSVLSFEARATTVKTRVVARQQQMIRLDQEESSPYTSTEVRELLYAVERHINKYSIVILSDYNKGVISHEFMEEFNSIVAAKKTATKVLVDPKPENNSLYRGVFAITPNLKEAAESAGGVPVRTMEEIVTAGRIIFKEFSPEMILTTLGAEGMVLFRSPKDILHIPTVARDVYDVTGAGDTVIAAFGMGLSVGFDAVEAAALANYAAGIVVGKVGAATVSPLELSSAIKDLPKLKASSLLNTTKKAG